MPRGANHALRVRRGAVRGYATSLSSRVAALHSSSAMGRTGDWIMDFYVVLDEIRTLLQRRGRVTYRALKVQFQLDDEHLEALKEELIEAEQLAVDEQGKVLVWTGVPASEPPLASLPASDQERAPLAYTPQHLAEKILTSRSAPEGER